MANEERNTELFESEEAGTRGLSLKGRQIMPTIPSQRTIGTWGFFLISVAMYVQLVSFIAGSQVYPALSPLTIVLAVIVGNLVVWGLLVLTGDIGLKHGVPFAVYARAPFGYLGAHIPALVRALPALFWFGFQTWLASQALNIIMQTLTGYSNLTLLIILFGAFQIINTAMGIDAIAKFDWVATPILFITGIIIEIALLRRYDVGVSDLFSTQGEGGISFLTAVAIMAGAQITMAVNISDITRSMRTSRASSWSLRNRGSAIAQFFGLVPPMAFYVIVGMTSGIATGEWNPILVMADVFGGNTLLLVLVLGSFVLFAQVASNTGQNLLPPGYVFVNLFPRRINFPVAVIAAGVVGLVITPWNFAEYIPTVQLIVTALLGPIVGIMVSDYYLIRKTNVNVKDLYEAGGQYRYWNNFNPAALIVYFASAAVGILVPNFSFFVALVASFIAYYALMRLWILPRYPQSETESNNKTDDQSVKENVRV